MAMKRNIEAARKAGQMELFDTASCYPVRRVNEAVEPMCFDGKLKRAMSRALKDCSLGREEIAARMGVILGQDNFSLNMLNAYTAESRENHNISVIRLKAFIKATGAVWLWDVLVEDDGCIVMQGEEARLAELGLIDQQLRKLNGRRKELRKEEPVEVKRYKR